VKRRAFIIGAATVATLGGGAAVSIAGMGSPGAYARSMARLRAPLRGDPDITELIRFATLAANGHNTQPWPFRVSGNSVRLMPDLSRRTPAVDPDDHHLYVSLGCATENLSLAAAASGLPGEARFDPEGEGIIVFDYGAGPAQPSPLCDAIPRRQSARTAYDGRAAPADELEQLVRAAETPGVALTLITDRAQINRISDLVIAGNSVQMADGAFMRELKSWMRFNPNAALRHGDGLYSACSGNPILPTWLGGAMFDLAFKAEAENEKYARYLATSAGVAVFLGAQIDTAHWVQVGRACQRFALQATALGMKLAFDNQPVEVAALRGDLAALIGMPGRRPDIVMRFGYGPDLPMSARRPAEAVIDT
jgi:hypothetical protein